MSSIIKKATLLFAKGITNISLTLAILFMILSIFFLLVSGGSLLSAYMILQKHQFITSVAVVIALWMGTTLPVSITSFLIPEAIVSKVVGVFGVTTNVASALVLLIMIAFFSVIGAITSLILAIIFLLMALIFKKIGKKEKGTLIFISGILCLVMFLWFFITMFLVKGIVIVMLASLILSLIFLSIGISLLLPYIKELIKGKQENLKIKRK